MQKKKKRLIEEVGPAATVPELKPEPESEAMEAQPEAKPKKKRKKAAAAAADEVAEAATEALLQQIDTSQAAGASASLATGVPM